MVTAFSFASPADGKGAGEDGFQVVEHHPSSGSGGGFGAGKRPHFAARKPMAGGGPRPPWAPAPPKPAAAWGATAPVSAAHKQQHAPRSRFAKLASAKHFPSGPYGANRVVREPSIDVSGSWNLLEEVDFSRLNKLFFTPADPVDMYVGCLCVLLVCAWACVLSNGKQQQQKQWRQHPLPPASPSWDDTTLEETHDP